MNNQGADPEGVDWVASQGGGGGGGGPRAREIPLDCKAEEDLLKQNDVNLLRRAVNYKGTVKTLRPSNTKRKQLALSPFS